MGADRGRRSAQGAAARIVRLALARAASRWRAARVVRRAAARAPSGYGRHWSPAYAGDRRPGASRSMTRPALARLAIYAGSFDPPTFGHLDLIERASALFSDVIVGLGEHATRSPLFTVEERLVLVSRVSGHVRQRNGRSVRRAAHRLLREKAGARVIVRGLRAATDFEYELQIAHANADLEPNVDTVFLPTRTKMGFISASLVREIASHGGDVSRYAPAAVCAALAIKFG